MRHENQFGAQQSNAFGTLLHRTEHARAFTDVGEHFHRMTVEGQRRLMTLFSGDLEPLLAAVAFFNRALQGRGVGIDMQSAALAIQQQRGARCQQQHCRARADQRRDTQRPGDDSTVGGGATPCGKNAGDPGRIQPRHIGRPHFIHHQNVRLRRLAWGFNAAQLRQHPAADIAQVCRAFGEQGVLQGLLLPGCRVNHRHPGRLRTLPLLETGIDLIRQFRVVEHFLVSNENLTNGLGLAALDQPFNAVAHLSQRRFQPLALDRGGLATQWVINGLLNLYMGRTNGNPRRGGNGLNQAARARRDDLHGVFSNHRWVLDRGRQGFNVFPQPLFNGRQQGGQGIGGNARLGDQLQHLPTTGTQAQQFAQAFHRHRTVLAIDDPHANLAVKALGQLGEDFRWPRMQTVGVGQRDASAGPISRQLATEHLQDCATAGGPSQFMAATFNQQGA
ncbi:hypothetical protein D3C84_488780 [compost metagenome]